jgi:MFS family permease
MFSAKWTFVCGFAWVGIFCLGIGFSRDKTTLIVLRAFSGIGASATIPAALNLIVHLFPDEKEQAGALSA